MTAATQTQTAEAQDTTIDAEAEEVASTLVLHMTAAEIRAWMSENGLTRTRGARKMASALQAFEQDPELATGKAEELTAGLGRFHVVCGHCDDLDEHIDDADDAVAAAKTHRSENRSHVSTRVVDTEVDERIYG